MIDWKDYWNRAGDFESHLACDADKAKRWRRIYDKAELTDAQRDRLATFIRPIRLLTMSGIWCGDCVAQVPLIQRIAEGRADLLEHRVIAVEATDDAFKERFAINGGHRVPVLFVLSEDFYRALAWGDRTLSRYRLLADVKRAMRPGATREDYYQQVGRRSLFRRVIRQTTNELLDEIERVQLLFQVSPRLTALAEAAAPA